MFKKFDKNLREFLFKFIVLAVLLLAVRALFQVPVEYFRLRMFYEQEINRVFSKGDAIKVIVMVGVLFILYLREKISKIHHPKINWKESVIFFLISVLSVAGYYGLRYITNLYKIEFGTQLLLIVFGKFILLLISFLALLFAVFQRKYVFEFYNHFKKELFISSVFAVIFYFILMYFQSKWAFFSGIVMNFLVFVFSNFYPVSVKGVLLTVDNFTIGIGAACSGIESLMLFFALYLVILAMDYKKIKIIPYIITFIIGLIGTFIVNNLRLLLLVYLGLKVSPKLAVGLFHTHAGWILFIIYFIGFFAIVKRIIYKE
ncbi:MAG: archaeosortase/exosortase family protein [Candidatus Woesearchaeota archaeon]